MTIKELFKNWNKNVYIGDICAFGGIEGGPGYIGFGACKNENHPNVRYGCEHCPKNCSDFRPSGREFETFLTYYRNHASYFNEKYDIDENDEYYVRPNRTACFPSINHEPEDPTELF